MGEWRVSQHDRLRQCQRGPRGPRRRGRKCGTGTQRAPTAAGSVTIELRSVNSRFLDLVLRLPDEFRALEPALRDLVGSAFRRGKIELRLNAQIEAASAAGRSPSPNS